MATGHLVLVMDNVSQHRSPVMKDWWTAQNGRTTPSWVPRHHPHLNLVEPVWRFLKQHVACHRFWDDVEALQSATATLLDRLDGHFHTEEAPSLLLRKGFCQFA